MSNKSPYGAHQTPTFGGGDVDSAPLNYGHFKLGYALADLGLGWIQMTFYQEALQSAYDKELSFTFGYYENEETGYLYFKMYGYKKRWYTKEKQQEQE